MRRISRVAFAALCCFLAATASAWSQCRVPTFDDGPLPPWTDKVLDALKQAEVKATFFVVGNMARAYPDTLKRIVAEGHELGVHSDTHPLGFEHLTEAQVRKEFADADATIKKIVGFVPRIVRIPGGANSRAIRAELKGRIIVGWGKHSDPEDWKYRDTKRTVHVVSAMPPDEILLLHDIVPTTSVSVSAILANYQQKGSRFITVTEFLNGACAPRIAGK